jgi:hypothetical protein
VNGDHRPDLIVLQAGSGSGNSGSVGILLGNANGTFQNNPNVGLGNDGTAVVVWRTRTGVSYAVRSGGSWSAAAGLPVLVGQAGGSTGVAVDGSGNAVAIFAQVTISPGTYATYRPLRGGKPRCG